MPDGTTCRLFTCEGMVAVCAPSSPLAGETEIPLSRLCEQTMIDLRADWAMRRLVDQTFAGAGLSRQIGFEVNDMAMLLDLAAGGLGVALVPRTVATERMRTGAPPVAMATLRAEDEPCWELVAAFRGKDETPSDPVVKAYLEFLDLPEPPA